MKRSCFFILFFIGLAQSSFAQYRLYEDGLNKYKDKNYDACIQLLTDFLSKPLRDKKFDIDAYYYRALSYNKKGNFKDAIADFEETILLNHPNKGNIYWFMAKSHYQLKQYPDAISSYTSAIRELGGDKETKAKLLYERSIVYTKSSNQALAVEDLKNGFLLSPNNNEIKQEIDKLEKQGLVSRSALLEGTKVASQKKEVVNPPVEQKTEVKKEAAVVLVPVQTQPKEPTLADLYKDEKRYALVIGNSNYPKNIGVLKNPVNDATDMAEELRKSNFVVDLLTNATYGQMRAAMLRFKEKVDASDREKTVALFYFAGHGLRNEEENFLVPIDASIEFEDDIARYCFPVQRMVLANMERSNSRMNIVILDACRNNPFPSLTRSMGEQGLGEMKRARGSFIAYATAPGSVAADGSGRNGLYTQELLKAMKKPGLTIESVFKEVRASVLRLSGDKQNTWDSSNITGEFYFRFN
jgi:tetratricopeptide (TPR) repeat protein